jgi:hypothetical protein
MIEDEYHIPIFAHNVRLIRKLKQTRGSSGQMDISKNQFRQFTDGYFTYILE